MGALEKALDEIHSPRPSGSDDVDPIPMIVFLTDGRPNRGEEKPEIIIRKATVHNSAAPHKANIYTLAFGEDADKAFLRELSLKNEGFMTHIYDSADAEQQLKDFYTSISSPVMHNIVFKYPPDQVEKSSMTKHKINLVFQGSQGVTAGKAKVAEITGKPEYVGRVDYDARQKYVAETAKRRLRGPTDVVEQFGPLERMWAYLNIRQLEERYIASGDEEYKQKALDLALEYQFVTDLTAMAIVKPDQLSDAITTDSVDGERIKDPSQRLVDHTSPDASQGGSTPEELQRLKAEVQSLRKTNEEQAAIISQLRVNSEEQNRKMEEQSRTMEALNRKMDTLMASIAAQNPHRRRRHARFQKSE